MSLIGEKVGNDMIACVDADYDYLLQGATQLSRTILNNPFVFHTYAYAIENLQCFAGGLHEVCVAATLNDHFCVRLHRLLFAVIRALCFPSLCGTFGTIAQGVIVSLHSPTLTE